MRSRSSPTSSSPPTSRRFRQDARDEIITLIEKLQQLDPSLTSDHHDRHFMLAKWRLEKLEKDDRQNRSAGRHSTRSRTSRQRNFQVKRNLLRIGARVSPDAAAPLLEQAQLQLRLHFLEDRAEALLLLGEVAPEVLLRGRATVFGTRRPTVPNSSTGRVLHTWVAHRVRASPVDSPVPMMSHVAMNFALGADGALHGRSKALADHGDDPLARAALEAALVESSR